MRCGVSSHQQPSNQSLGSNPPTPTRLSRAPDLRIIASRDITQAAPDVNSVAFSPDGTALIMATGDDYEDEDATWVWDATTGELLARIPSETDIVQSAAFHPDGNQLVCAYGNHFDVWVADPYYVGTAAERWRRTATPQRRFTQTLPRPVGDPTGRWDPAKWGPRRWDRERFGFERSYGSCTQCSLQPRWQPGAHCQCRRHRADLGGRQRHMSAGVKRARRGAP